MKKLLFSIILFSTLAACSDKPNDVLSEGKMIDLLVDLHKAEAYVDVHPGEFPNDSMKFALEQSVYMRHGVTNANVDSTLVWYAHHAEDYSKLYEKVIQRLQDESDEVGENIKHENRKSIENGDSVDVWSGLKVRCVSEVVGNTTITFDVNAATDSRPGDAYVWRFRLLNKMYMPNVMIGVDYSDGSTGYLNRDHFNSGWNEVTLQTDSTKSVKRIYGMAAFSRLPKNEVVMVDSISLVRTHLNRERYFRFYSVKTLRGKASEIISRKKFERRDSFMEEKFRGTDSMSFHGFKPRSKNQDSIQSRK